MSDAPDDLPEWEADVVLSDGGTVHFRPVRPDDADRLVAFHGRLSPETIYFRFFSPRPVLTAREVERFVTVDFSDRVALVAMLGEDMIGIARYERWPGRDEAEVAFVVEDAHQGRGLGTLMLEYLAAIARRRGITRFTADTLPENKAMIGVFVHAGFQVHRHFAGGVVEVVLDLVPTPEVVEAIGLREQRAERRSIARLLAARSVAVIGASTQTLSVGNALVRNLLSSDFGGVVYPVNPNAVAVCGVRAYASLADVPDVVDLALVAVPAEAVAPVVDECAAKGVRGLVVYAVGFADTGESGAVLERELIERARRSGMRVIGPASMGLIVNGEHGAMRATFASVSARPGPIAVSSQSGPLGAAIVEQLDQLGLGISSFVSLGNKGDVSANDLLQYWYDDPSTQVVCMYTQSFGNPRKWSRVARRVARRKPVIAVKPNADEPRATIDALFRQAGVIRVESVEALLDTASVLAQLPLPAGPRIGFVTNSVGAAVLAVDATRAAGLELAVFAPETVTAMETGGASIESATVDLSFTAAPADFRRALDVLLADPGVDAVIVVDTPPITRQLDLVVNVTAAAVASAGKPAIVVGLGGNHVRGAAPIPVFTFPERAAAALGHAAAYSQWRSRAEGRAMDVDIDRNVVAQAIAETLVATPGGGRVSVEAGRRMLEACGVAVATTAVAASSEEAVTAAASIGYPVALKADGVVHLGRSESGGIALDIQNATELIDAYGRMRAALGPAMDACVVQAMVPAGVEVRVTLDSDPIFGPVVGFGLGGVQADAIGDRVVRALPLTDLDAISLVHEARAFRAMAYIDVGVEVAADLLTRVGALADAFAEIESVSLNPVMVSSTGAFVLDADIRVVPAHRALDVPLRRLR
ncbi:MAG: GNAT family N-acetyltransferase [Acidimicrobiia bacterium]